MVMPEEIKNLYEEVREIMLHKFNDKNIELPYKLESERTFNKQNSDADYMDSDIKLD